jgi:hypothetical protein
MKSLNELVEEIEPVWRNDVREDHHLRSNTPVVHTQKKSKEDWSASTDLKSIFFNIANDEKLKREFKEIIAPLWDGNPEDLARDTIYYLLDHELFHALEAPFSTRQSTENEDNDNTKIHQAIRRGILKAEPDLSASDQLAKVYATQNGVKDFILDNRVYLDKQGRSYRDDIIPTWDVLQIHDSEPKTNFYTVTRLLYGLLYGPESTHELFQEKAGEGGCEVANEALSKLIQDSVSLPSKRVEPKKSLGERDKSSLGFSLKADSKEEEEQELFTTEQREEYIRAIRNVFSSEDRYEGIERFMNVLGPYVEKGMPQGRPDLQGESSGSTSQNILQDLLDDMSPEEQAEFTQGLADPKGEGNDFSEGKANSDSGEKDSNDEFNTLDILALHEFYKRNHPVVKIIGGNKVGETQIIGKQEYWDLVRSEVITEDQLERINLNYVAKFQQKTGKPMLIPLEDNLYLFNEYELKQEEIKDIIFVDEQLDVPDEVDIYIDSSGSMFQNQGKKFGFNDGSRWDLACHVIYGFVDALYQGAQQLKKSTRIRIHNVGNRQISSQAIQVEDFLAGDKEVLETLFKPANGYNHEDLDIIVHEDNLKRVSVIVTDGNLVISGRTKRETQKIREVGKNPRYDAILFEIGGTYDLGKAVSQDPNVHYHRVHNKETMLEQGVEVLLGK